jgi:hypothetical protein
MRLVYYISTRKLTAHIADHATDAYVPVLNEILRPHMENADEREGDFVHANLEQAKTMAFDILCDLGDKGIDLLCIALDDDFYAELEASGDIRDSVRKDAWGGRLLKISQRGCLLINHRCEVQPVTFLVQTGLVGDAAMTMQ